jgi:hypothetical protein
MTCSIWSLNDSQYVWFLPSFPDDHVMYYQLHHSDTFDLADVGRFNTSNFEEIFEKFSILDQKVHPNYNNEGGNNNNNLYSNLMIVKINGQSTNTEPIMLNMDAKEPKDNEALTVIGFGQVGFGFGKTTNVLQMLTVTTIANDVCETLVDPSLDIQLGGDLIVEEQHICADAADEDNNNNNAGVCVGDFGGPLILPGGSEPDQQDVLVGVVIST